jgi:O-antigen ligase
MVLIAAAIILLLQLLYLYYAFVRIPKAEWHVYRLRRRWYFLMFAISFATVFIHNDVEYSLVTLVLGFTLLNLIQVLKIRRTVSRRAT